MLHKLLLCLAISLAVVACSNTSKPPLDSTQVVDGKSIVIPPEFDAVPDVNAKDTHEE